MPKHIESENILDHHYPQVNPLADDIKKFWTFVDVGGPDECWLWNGFRNKDGYGDFSLRGIHILAHRFSWLIHYGKIPEEKPCVLHDCPGGDNPACINPAHLWVGTNSDNTHDMISKGRVAVGTRHGMAKLSEEQVREIRTLIAGGEPRKSVSTRFGITLGMICLIVNRKNWTHI